MLNEIPNLIRKSITLELQSNNPGTQSNELEK